LFPSFNPMTFREMLMLFSLYTTVKAKALHPY
jgi:hypothetical protein